jgi:2-polyprenyl-3-methyl-5-hydroxy-6-metoxy-1,4-benzoquinol methylase
MRLEVLETQLANHRAESIEQDALAFYACPVCGRDDALQLIGSVVARGLSSLESAFCTRCFHRFHRKFPRQDWLDRYYKAKYQHTGGAPAEPPRRGGFLAAARRPLGRAWRALRGQETPHPLWEFCDGVLRGSGAYHARDASIRKVLEVGCGYGDNLAFLKERGYRTWGTESSPVRVAACRARGLDVSLTGPEGFGEAQAHAPFDFIYSVHVLEHIIHADAHVAALVRMLRNGGYVYVETPHLTGESLIYQTHTIFHVHTFSLRSMLSLLAKHGLHPVRMLVDNNIKVLACKGEVPPLEPALAGEWASPFQAQYAPYVGALARRSPGEFRVRWDHYHVQVTDAAGAMLFSGSLGAMQVAPGPNVHEVVLRSPEGVLEGAEFPLVFDHVREPSPPIWYKL